MSARRARTALAGAGPSPHVGAGVRRLGAAAGLGWQEASRWVTSGGRTWRRSLQLRVVVTTMLLGLLVVSALGGFLAQQISRGLFEARTEGAQVEAARAAADLQDSFDNATATDPANLDLLVQQVLRLRLRGVGSDEVGMLLLPGPDAEEPGLSPVATQGFHTSDVPAALRAAVASSDAQQLTPMAMPGSDGQVPALAIGSTVQAPGVLGPYELYMIFSLEQEQQALDLVQRVLAVGGVVLVLLVGAVAYVVTRQVVTPVQMAARVAERLSSGRLDERMEVRGEDDLALLARSFNEMAESLQRQISQLEELSRLQRRFVSDVSHELRTPLTTVRMAGEVLHEARADFDPAVARSAELLTTQLDRFEELLADLLEISRFDAGAAALDAEPADVRDLVARVVEAAAPLAERRGSALLVHATPAPCVAQVDSRRVDRILRNLVVNAIEHGEGRPIDVTVDCDEHAVAVLVRDSGVGLRPEDVGMVFNRFWRADPARARTTGGTGLGLAIALEDAHLHGGWLQAHGERGRGAAFRLTLPRQAGAQLRSSPLPLRPPSVAALHAGRERQEQLTAAGPPLVRQERG